MEPRALKFMVRHGSHAYNCDSQGHPPLTLEIRLGLENLKPLRNLRPPLSFSMEMCDQRHNITMCPLCDKTCNYWKMSSACATARASHLFDNPATVFFSVFMALWGKWSLHLGPPTQIHSLLTLSLMFIGLCPGCEGGSHGVPDGHRSVLYPG